MAESNLSMGLRNTEGENDFVSHSTVVVTTTLYRDFPNNLENRVRGNLALNLVEAAKRNGFQLVVIDGGSSEDFLSGLRELGVNPSKEREVGMSASRQQGFLEASVLSDARFISWTEPEKNQYIADPNCLQKVSTILAGGKAKIGVPKRQESLFEASYPGYQVRSEREANRRWNDILRRYGLREKEDEDLDVWFGPKSFVNEPEIVKLFTQSYEAREISNPRFRRLIKPELWPNAIFFPIVSALLEGYSVASVEVPYVHS